MGARLHSASAAVGAAFAISLAAPAAAVIELPRGSQPLLRWTPAPGDVDVYVLEISCNGGERVEQRLSRQPEAILAVAFCDTMVVRVAASLGSRLGPYSPESDLIRFVDTPPSVDGDTSLPLPAAAPPTTLDFDGDGRADVLMRRPDTGALEIWSLENGAAIVLAELPTLPPVARIVGNGDVNGDGRADILHLDPESGELGVWLVSGSGLIGGGPVDTLAPGWSVIGNGDCDGDGRADVLLHDEASGSLELWTLDGASRLEAVPLSRPAPAGSQPIATGDYDGDGRADLLWYDPLDGRVDLWILDGATVVEASQLASGFHRSWEIVASGDFDADGHSDLLWRNPPSGESRLWFFEAGELAAQARLDPKLSQLLRVKGAADHDGDGADDLLLWGRLKRRLVVQFQDGSLRRDRARMGRLTSPWEVSGIGERRPR